MKIVVLSLKGWAGKHDLNGEYSKYLLTSACFSKNLPFSFNVSNIEIQIIPISMSTDCEYILLGCRVLPPEKL